MGSLTPPPSTARPQTHLVTCDDCTCPLVGLVQFMPTVRFLLEPGLLSGRVLVPEAGRLYFGDKFYIINKDERLEDGPGEKGEGLQPDGGGGGGDPEAALSLRRHVLSRLLTGRWVEGGGEW